MSYVLNPLKELVKPNSSGQKKPPIKEQLTIDWREWSYTYITWWPLKTYERGRFKLANIDWSNRKVTVWVTNHPDAGPEVSMKFNDYRGVPGGKIQFTAWINEELLQKFKQKAGEPKEVIA